MLVSFLVHLTHIIMLLLVPRLTVRSSSTAKRWWTSTCTAWSSPWQPTPSTFSIALRSRRKSEPEAPRSTYESPGGTGAMDSRGTRTSITTDSEISITRKRLPGQRGAITMIRLSRRTSRRAPHCTLLSTRRTFYSHRPPFVYKDIVGPRCSSLTITFQDFVFPKRFG